MNTTDTRYVVMFYNSLTGKYEFLKWLASPLAHWGRTEEPSEAYTWKTEALANLVARSHTGGNVTTLDG